MFSKSKNVIYIEEMLYLTICWQKGLLIKLYNCAKSESYNRLDC